MLEALAWRLGLVAESFALVAVLLGFFATPLAAQVAVPARDTVTAARPDTAAVRGDTSTSAAAKPDTAVVIATKRDSAVVITTRATPAKKGAKAAPEPPYRIEADRMTGGRGPNGDVLFLEKVTITRTRTRLQSERGRYERATGMVYLEGNVRLRDSTANVTCDEATFSEHEDRLDLRGNVVVTDRDATLKAPQGWYDRKNGSAQLTGGVRGQEKKQRLVADEAFYQRDSMVVRARGHVIGNDDENKIQIEAKAVDFDRRTKLATATGEPLMRAFDDDNKETVLRARLLKVNSETRIAEAIDSVRVDRDTLRASANYARFDDNTGRGVLLGSPRAWDNETQVTGDTLETIAVKRKLERVIVRGGAVIDYAGARETNKGETSRLTGAQVDMFVGESTIDSLVATGKAHNEYTASPKEGKTAERNVTKGDTIVVFFKDKKIDRARVQGGATGDYQPPVAVGDTAAARQERVAYDGRRIEFVIPKNKIVLDGDAHLSYRELELHARRVEFDSQRNTLVAEGKPQIVEKGDELNGQLMTYDLDRKVGTVYQATTEYERGLYHGKEIRKATDNELDVLGGAYSTCDLEQPHYHFSSRYMKIYLKDKMVAKPVIFYVRNVPVLALPFWVFPIKPGRHSGFLFPQVEFGFNTTTGQFVRNGGYYWAPNDYFDVTGAGDYYQGTATTPSGWAARGEANYKLLYAFDGHMEGRFDRSTDAFGGAHENYQFYGTHQQTIGERTRLSALGSFVSSREYNNSAFSNLPIGQRLNRFLNSNAQLSHYADWISLNAIVDRRQDLDATQPLEDPKGTNSVFPKIGQTATLPSLTVSYPSLSASLPTRALGSYGFIKDRPVGKLLASTYMTLSGRFLALEERRGVVTDTVHFTNAAGQPDSSTVVGETVSRRQGAASTFALSDSRRLFGWINFSPSLFGNAVVFDHDKLGNKVVPAATWQASAGLGTTLYRTMKMPFPGFGMRHILTPTANIVYSPEFPGLTFVDSNGVRQERFDQISDIGIFSGRKAVRTNFAIDQRFQAKLGSGEHVRRLDNLLSWTTSGSYDFLWRENGAKHGLSQILTGMRLQPPGWVNGDASANIDVYSGRPLQSFSYNLSSSFNSSGSGKPQSPRIATDQLPQRGYYVESQEPDDFRETWSAALSYSYSGGYFSSSRWSSHETLNGVLRYQLTDNWTFDYQAGYDLTQHLVLLQRFNITRRIHCWEATFSRSFNPRGETEYFFHLGIREQKEVYYERGTRQQSIGGIQ
jgi:lipopolysaccharide assembly outer membrane protein LptD (OstA)